MFITYLHTKKTNAKVWVGFVELIILKVFKF